MLRVTYEACHADFAGTLQAILDYYELPPPERSLSSIARDASFAEMKKLEESGAFDQPWLRTRNGAAKVRSGKVGGFRTELSAADLSYLNEVFQRPD